VNTKKDQGQVLKIRVRSCNQANRHYSNWMSRPLWIEFAGSLY